MKRRYFALTVLLMLVLVGLVRGDEEWRDEDGLAWRYEKTEVAGQTCAVITKLTTKCPSELTFPQKIGGLKVTCIGAKDASENLFSGYRERNLKSVVIPEGVETIGDSAFDGCVTLAEVTLPETLKTIGMYSFAHCNALTSLEIPKGVNLVSNYAFAYSKGIEVTAGPNTEFGIMDETVNITVQGKPVVEDTKSVDSSSSEIAVTVDDNEDEASSSTNETVTVVEDKAEESSSSGETVTVVEDKAEETSSSGETVIVVEDKTEETSSSGETVVVVEDKAEETSSSGETVIVVEDKAEESDSSSNEVVEIKDNAVLDDRAYLVVNLETGKKRFSNVGPDLGNDICRTTELWLRRIPAGSFVMGSPTDELGRKKDEKRHKVTISQDFYIGVFEMTQAQYEIVMKKKPSYFSNKLFYATRPVEMVTFDDIRGTRKNILWPKGGHVVEDKCFLGRLRKKVNMDFDLPTEAQWEYACRAETQSALNSGKNLTSQENCRNLSSLGRTNANDGKTEITESADTSLGTIKVGSFKPNAWGLYDMHGNVAEWCLDWYGEYPDAATTDPVGPENGQQRVCRGGSWLSKAGSCRAAFRYRSISAQPMNSIGFRVVLPSK